MLFYILEQDLGSPLDYSMLGALALLILISGLFTVMGVIIYKKSYSRRQKRLSEKLKSESDRIKTKKS